MSILRPRIEMVLPSLEIGGMEHMVATLATRLQIANLDVGITCLDGEGELVISLKQRGIRVSHVSAKGAQSNIYAPALVKHLISLQPDVVHSHTGTWGRACHAARRAGVRRIVHTVHGKPDKDPWYDVPLKRWEARQSDVVVAVSEPLAEDLICRVGLDRNRIVVLENGIDTDRFCPNEGDRLKIRTELGIQDQLVLGTVARLAPVKNLVGLLKAFRLLQGQLGNDESATLLLIGGGPLEAELRSQVDALGLGNSCRLLGAREDTNRLHRAFDIFVLPSLAEGTSISLLEAMASATIAVATPVGGNPHLLGNGSYGFLSADTEVKSIAHAMQRAVHSLGSSDIGRLAREHVRAYYSADLMTRRYQELYGVVPAQ